MSAHSAVWQAYVDSSLMGSGKFDKAAILSYNLSGTEASSAGFSISTEELQGLAAALADSSVAWANGIKVGGEKFVTIQANDRSLYGKKGKEGIVVVKAKSCVMIGHHPETIPIQSASTVVEGLVDYINNNS